MLDATRKAEESRLKISKETKEANDSILYNTKKHYIQQRYKKDPNFNETSFWEECYDNADID